MTNGERLRMFRDESMMTSLLMQKDVIVRLVMSYVHHKEDKKYPFQSEDMKI